MCFELFWLIGRPRWNEGNHTINSEPNPEKFFVEERFGFLASFKNFKRSKNLFLGYRHPFFYVRENCWLHEEPARANLTSTLAYLSGIDLPHQIWWVLSNTNTHQLPTLLLPFCLNWHNGEFFAVVHYQFGVHDVCLA